MRWRHRLPELTDNEDGRPVVTAVDVHEQLDRFRELTRGKFCEIRQETNSLEEKMVFWKGLAVSPGIWSATV